MRRKGKVHPSPSASASSSSSSSSSAPYSATTNKDAQSVLKLLPTAILTIVSVLSLNDREVLAYMISRSIKSPIPSDAAAAYTTHKPPIFDCECFDCYTSYWCRWDSSPNRELIHQAIEGFEEHLYKRELPASRKGKKNKKKEKIEKLQQIEATPPESENIASKSEPAAELVTTECGMNVELLSGKVLVDGEVERRELLPEKAIGVVQGGGGGGVAGGGGNNHKGLARKVLPDVLGLFNSRLWNLWGPNI